MTEFTTLPVSKVRKLESIALGLFRYLLLFSVLFTTSSVFGATITSNVVTGNWNATSSWVGGAIPLNTDDVVIASGASITINQAVTCASLTVDGALTTDATNRAVNISGALVVNGSFNIFRCNPLTVLSTTTVNGTLTDTDNNGSSVFQGRLTINPTGTFSPTSSSAFTFQNGISNNGVFNKSGAGVNTFNTTIQTLDGANPIVLAGAMTNGTALTINTPATFSGAATINAAMTINSAVTFGSTSTLAAAVAFNAPVTFTGASIINIGQNITSPVTFSNTVAVNASVTVSFPVTFTGNVTIADGVTITNQSQAIVVGVLNGAALATTAKWLNDVSSTLEYRNGTAPMAIGVLDATANGNTVIYKADGTQTIKLTDYFNLQTSPLVGTGNYVKQIQAIAAVFNVLGDLTVGQYTTFLNSGADAIQTLTVKGVIVNNGTITLQTSNLRYCDLFLENSGDLILGSSSAIIRLRNLTLTNVAPKTVSYTGNIDFYTGASGNAFTNNDGDFTATAGAFRFMDAFSIGGTGTISFNNLQCGNNNQTIQTLSRDVTVNGTLTLNHSNTASSYLNLNGTSLTVIGGFTRTNYGEFGGSASSNLILGNGNTPIITATYLGTCLNFETGVELLNTLTHNVVSGATYYGVGAPLSVANLNIVSGEFKSTLATSNLTITNTFNNNGIYNQSLGTTSFNKAGGTIDIAGSGTHNFYTLQITDGTVTTANTLNVGLDFINNSNAVNSFVASAGAVTFIRANDQSIKGTGTGLVSFYNLHFPSQVAGRNRYLASNFTVANLMQIDNNNLVYFENSGWRTVNVNNLVIGGGTSGQMLVQATPATPAVAGFHQLNINGKLTVNAGSTLNLRNATNKYADVTFNGAGSVLDGNGAFAFHSIQLTNASAKSFDTPSNINFYAGANSPHQFINNGGDFTTTQGNMLFRDNLTDWSIGGTGAISLANMQIGWNTTTNLKQLRDITITNNINFYQNLATNYLDLNGYTLTLNGNHTRQNNGRIRGGATSKMIINGSGNFTTSFAFDQATPGITNRLAQLDYNRGADGVMVLGNLMEVDQLNLQQGIINSSAGSINVTTQANLLNGSFIDNNNGGVNTFSGALSISSTAIFNPTSASVLNIGGAVINDGLFSKDGAGTTVFIGNTTLGGSKPFNFLNGALTVNDGVTVTNNSVADGIGVNVALGTMNGAGAGAVWSNLGILTYSSATAPMVVGTLSANTIGNRVIYNRVQNTQTIKNTTYYHLQTTGGGLRTMMGITNVDGDLTIGEENIFYTAEFQLNGTASGILTMLESSELRIGNNVDTSPNPQPVFPTGFVRANIVLDPISMVAYNGRVQDISSVPIYSNLSFTNTAANYSKNLTGDVVANGYFTVLAGTLVFSAITPQTFTLYGDLYASGGTINMSGGGLSHVLNLYGAVNQANRFTAANNSKVSYLSTDNQQMFSPTGGDYYGKLEIGGGSVKTIELDTEVDGELIMTSGIIRLGDKSLTLNSRSAAAMPITGTCSATNMIETNGAGKLVKRGNGGTPWAYLSGVYPVGADGKYTPITIANLTGSVGTGWNNMYVRSVSGRHPSVSSIYDALLRYWDISTTLTTAKTNATFEYSPLDVIGDPAKYKAYLWNGSAFSNPAGSTVGGTTITLPTNTVLTPAGTQVTAYDNVTIRKTLYSYKDGPWDDPDSWTTDPSGQNLEGATVPASSDNVVILASRSIYFANNVASSGLIITINSGGTLDLRDKGFTQTVSIIQGQGTLKLASNQMPPASQNTLVNDGGGTVEYNVPDASFVLNSQAVYNNLTLYLTNSTNKAVLNNNLTLYGNLQVLKGNLQIYKDDASATQYNPIVIDVKKDLIVSASGGILTGTASTSDGLLPPGGTTPGALVPRYYDSYHKVYIGGSLYNQGTVKFISSDITSIDFENLTTRGAATVRFYGIDNSTLECSGITDFYNLIIDKGTGLSAELAVNASQTTNFRLFGPNSYIVYGGFSANPEVRKALWIRNGTMRLLGSTTIPSLCEGRLITLNSSYVIPAFGAMIIDSPNATVLTTADSPNEVTAAWGVGCSGVTNNNFLQDFYLSGRLTVNDGYFSTRFSGGVVFNQLSGELIVNGGKLSARQIRTNQAGTSSFSQTAGEVELLGAYTYNTSGSITTVDDIRNVPIVYVYNTTRLAGEGTFYFPYPSNVFKMSGGDMNIYNTSGGNTSCALRVLSDASSIESTGGNVNVYISRNTAYDMRIPNGFIPNLNVYKSAGTGTLRLADNLSVNGNLTLNGISELYANAASYQLSVAGDFTIGATAIYNPNQNNTRFFGTNNSSFIVDGVITSDLFGLQIDKSSSSLTLAGTNGNITLRGDLNINSGTFDDGAHTVTAKGSLYNSAVHTGTGKILVASGAVNRIIGGTGTGIWGNMELNEATGIVSTLSANQKVAGTLTMTAGLLDLSTFSLTLDGALVPSVASSYSASTMFATAGNSSDGGLIRKISSDGVWAFPIGTTAGTTRFTPTEATITGYTGAGYLQLNPVAKELPLLYQGSLQPALQYYWRVRDNGFAVLPNVSYLFGYSASDVLGDDLLYVAGKVVGATRYKLVGGVNPLNKTITYTPAEVLSEGDYTAAHPDRFDGPVPVFYSRNCATTGNWSDVNSWSETSHTGLAASRVPGDGDIVYIGSGGGCDNGPGGGDFHSVIADGVISVGKIIFSPVSSGVWSPRLIIPQTGNIAIDDISGIGTVVVQVEEALLPSVTADWGDFLSQPNSQVVYEIQSAGKVIVSPLAASYPNLVIEAKGDLAGTRYLSFDNNVTVTGSLTIDKGASLLMSDGANGDITVLGNTQLGGTHFGRLLFKGDGNPRTFTGSHILLAGTGNAALNQLSVQTDVSAGLAHSVVVTGNLTQNGGIIDLFSNNTGGSNATLLFTGATNANFTATSGTTPDLFKLIVNKGTSQTSQLTLGANFTLGAAADLAVKPLALQNGLLTLNNSSLNLILSTGGALFQIPATSGLVVSSGKVTISTDNNGLALYGKLRVDNSGIISLGDGSSNINSTLVYYGLTPIIEVANNGLLEVNSKIRRSTNTLAGSLKYRQTGGQVKIYGAYNNNNTQGRAKLEVLNSGSEFTMSGGTLSIFRGGGTTFGDLYLVPTTNSVTGGEIIFSQGTINGNVIYSLNSSVALPNLTITGNATNSRTATLNLMTLPLQVKQTFKFGNTFARFNTNNKNVTLQGDLDFKGLWTSGADDITYFAGSTQIITGSPTVNNVQANSSVSLTMQAASVLTVNGSLVVNTPQFVDGGNAIVVKKDVTNNGAFVNSTPLVATTGLKLRGGVNQKMSGAGLFGLVELDNISGATLNSDISLSNNLTLTRGVFNIGSRLLTMGSNASIVSGSAFSSSNMILTDGVYGTTGGLKMAIPATAAPLSYEFPIGSTGKYTPVQFNLTSNSTSGTLLIKPVNQAHTTVTDVNHVLQYYWVVESAGLSDLNGSLTFNYLEGDVKGDENLYIGARLTGIDWAKFPGVVDPSLNKVVIPYTAVTSLSGEYTTGEDLYIPDQVPLFVTIASGAWTDKTIWERDGGGVVPDGGPFGHRVQINATHTVTMNSNSRRVYNSIVNGRLEIGTTYGHNLGTVSGTGTLSIETNQLPAGKFDDFFSCSGGTMEYGGATSYTISNRYLTFKNLTITGSGVKTLPDGAVVVCSDLVVNSGTLKISHFSLGTATKSTFINGNLAINSSGVLETDVRETVYLKGNLIKVGTNNFNNEFLLQKFVLNGTSAQTLSGSFSGATQRFNDLTVDNLAGVSFDNNAEVVNYFYNTNGVTSIVAGSSLIISKLDGVANAGSATNYVAGNLRRLMDTGNNNSNFAVGGGAGLYKPLQLTGRTGSGNSYWNVEYVYGDNNPDVVTAPLTRAGEHEYYIISCADSKSAVVTYPLTGTNGIAATTVSLSDLRLARWNASAWEQVATSVVVTGTRTNGTLKTPSAIAFSSTPRQISLGCIQPRFYWTGVASSDWENGANWAEGNKPTIIDNAVIAVSPNNPVINGPSTAEVLGLTLLTGTKLTVNPGKYLTVNGNLSIADLNGLEIKNTPSAMASVITNGTMTGTALVTNVTPGGYFRYYGFSVKGASVTTTKIWDVANTQASIAAYYHTDSGYLRFGVADVNITNPTVAGTSGSHGVMNGFSVKQRYAGDLTIASSGQLNSGDVSTSLVPNKWALLCNPYPSAIKMLEVYALSSSNFGVGKIDPTYWAPYDQAGVAAFATYNMASQYSVNGGSELVGPQQVFWIKNTSTTTNYPFALFQSARDHKPSILKSMSLSTKNSVLRLKLVGDVFVDEVLVAFQENGSNGYTELDSEKRLNTGVKCTNIYTLIGATKWAIDVRGLLSDETMVPLGVNIGANGAGTYSIKALNVDGFDPSVDIFLDVTQGGVITSFNLRENSEIPVDLIVGDTDNRFALRFAQSNNGLPTSLPVVTGDTEREFITIQQLGNEALVTIPGEIDEKARIELYGIDGKLIKVKKEVEKVTRIKLPDIKAGYIIKVINGNHVYSGRVVSIGN